MKILPVSLLLVLTACSGPADRIPQPGAPAENVSSGDSLSHRGAISNDRTFADSANYQIIRQTYVSGKKYLEIYGDRKTKLDQWKAYYENGRLKEEGIMTTSNHIYVGVWKYYNASGKIDSVVDYNKHYPVSYFNALEIAGKNGFHMPDVDVELQEEGRKIFWCVVRWKENANKNGQTGTGILIDTETGEVTKPKYRMESIY